MVKMHRNTPEAAGTEAREHKGAPESICLTSLWKRAKERKKSASCITVSWLLPFSSSAPLKEAIKPCSRMSVAHPVTVEISLHIQHWHMSQERSSRASWITSKALTQDWFWHGLKCCKPLLGKGELRSQPSVPWKSMGITSPFLWFPSRKWVALCCSFRSLSRAVGQRALGLTLEASTEQRIMNMSWLLGLNITRNNFWSFCRGLPLKGFFCHHIFSWHRRRRAQQQALQHIWFQNILEWAKNGPLICAGWLLEDLRALRPREPSFQGLALRWLRAVADPGSQLGKSPTEVEFLMPHHKHSRVLWLRNQLCC